MIEEINPFENEDEKITKAFEKSKEFTYLQENLVNIKAYLKILGIGKVTMFDSLGRDIYQWKSPKCLTMIIMPIAVQVDEEGLNMIDSLKGLKLPLALENYRLCDIELGTEIMSRQIRTTVYLPTRNIVIIRGNPFKDIAFWKVVKIDLSNQFNNSELRMGFIDEDTVTHVMMTNMWGRLAEKRMFELNKEYKKIDMDIIEIRQKLIDTIRRKTVIKNDMNFSSVTAKERVDTINKQIKEIKAFPFLKSFKVYDSIILNYGHITIPWKLHVKGPEEKGVIKPTLKKVDVNIGELEFEIRDGRILVRNLNMKDGLIHPHATVDRVCFGEIEYQVHNLISKFDLIGLTKLLYSWAISYNPGDSYEDLHRFYQTYGGRVM